jgi:hypothetical protein
MQLESHDFDIVCDIGRVAEDGAQNCRSQNTDRLSAVFRLPKHVAKLRAFFKTEGGQIDIFRTKDLSTLVHSFGMIAQSVRTLAELPGYQFHPDLQVLVDNPLPYGTTRELYRPLPLKMRQTYLEPFLGMATNLRVLRQVYTSAEHKKRVRAFENRAKKNCQSLTEYVQGLFKLHQKLLVLRIDLHYGQAFPKKDSADQLLDWFSRMLNNRRTNKIFQGMVGHAAKLEYAPVTGFHLHCMFFYNGSLHRHDGLLGQRLGEYWRNVITDQQGRYFNCSAIKNTYKDVGIGLLHYSQCADHVGLQKAIDYMTKSELLLRARELGGTRRGFFRGVLPKQRSKSGRRRRVPQVL